MPDQDTISPSGHLGSPAPRFIGQSGGESGGESGRGLAAGGTVPRGAFPPATGDGLPDLFLAGAGHDIIPGALSGALIPEGGGLVQPGAPAAFDTTSLTLSDNTHVVLVDLAGLKGS